MEKSKRKHSVSPSKTLTQSTEVISKIKKKKLNDTTLSSPTSNNSVVIDVDMGTKKKKKKKKRRSTDDVKIELSPEEIKDDVESLEEILPDEDEEDLDTMFLCKIPKATYAELFIRIQNQIPDHDTAHSKTRLKKIDWSKVAFDGYTAARCQQIWEAVQKKQRSYRTLGELLADAKVWMDKPWQQYNKLRGNKMHPDFPKRPLSSYMLFYVDNKAAISKAHPGLKMIELSKYIGQKYKELKDSQKNKYIAKALKLKEGYDEAVKEFYKLHPEMHKDEDKQYMGPKKPPTPFVLYLQHQIANASSVGDKNEFRVAAKEKWNSLPDKKKIPWIKQACEQFEIYKTEFDAFKVEYPDTNVKMLKSILSKDEIKLKNKFDGVPLKPPNSVYALYAQTLMNSDELQDVSFKDKIKVVAAKWKDLSAAEKSRFQAKHDQLQKKYKEEFETYLQTLPEEERAKHQKSPSSRKRKVDPAAVGKKKTSKKDLTDIVTPSAWTEMEKEEKEMYLDAVKKIKNYFDSKHNKTISKKEEEPDETSEESSDE